MTDYTELKRLSESHLSLGQAYTVAKPSVLLALIADNDRLESEAVYSADGFDAALEEIARLKAENEVFEEGMRSIACSLSAGGYNAVTLTADQLVRKVNGGLETFTNSTGGLLDKITADRDQLRAEVQRLNMAVGIQTVRSFAGQTDQKSIDELLAAGIQVDKEEIARLRAEVAGLRTGYEACERVNAELKAEVEGLRKLGPSKEIIWCACGDGYPVNSHGAGFMDANNGVCANCDSANQGAEPDLDAPNSLAVLRKALSDLLALYDEDEGCRNLPQYIAGRAAMGKGEQSEGGHQAGHKSSESIDSEGLEGGLQ